MDALLEKEAKWPEQLTAADKQKIRKYRDSGNTVAGLGPCRAGANLCRWVAVICDIAKSILLQIVTGRKVVCMNKLNDLAPRRSCHDSRRAFGMSNV